MSTTLMPFLYQTRTLRQLSSRAGFSTPAFRALFHATARTHYPRQLKTPRDSSEIPFHFPPEYEPIDERSDAERDADSGETSTMTTSEREAFDRIFEEIRVKRAPKRVKSDVTPSLDEFAFPGVKSSSILSLDDEPVSTDSVFTPRKDTTLTLPSGPERPPVLRPHSSVNVILQDAADIYTDSTRRTKYPLGTKHALTQTAAAADWERAFLRFPPSLREAARVSLGLMKEDSKEQKQAAAKAAAQAIGPDYVKESELDHKPGYKLMVQNEAIRNQERARVDAKFRATKSDFELWDVLEEEVFPLVHKLGLDEEAAAETAKRGKGRPRAREKSRLADKLPLNIYGPLYPAYLLTALRHFDTRFARSSPLAMQILPRVKALGPASYVLGVSTPFYNMLARIMWNRHGNPDAVFDLLAEMRTSGLFYDHDTRRVVEAIESFLGGVALGNWGPFLREIGSLPEYEWRLRVRLRQVSYVISKHIVHTKEMLG
ncbi:uncharacterized protein C8A04DRAFT_34873 [Dichotomopilus funicola]|uniref:Mtf2-like C-terminal domain-containing protein n=1 Tax=Dichotomopilus funicola TaxID=1934379 RepID=A0AAN6ZP98_9PEZI|nr:hypothetical protein C8A04DRAFT_34873 [Dichotomopilus funicola]